MLRWAQPDNDRLAGSIFLLAIKGLGAELMEMGRKKWSSPYTLILQIGSMDDTDLRMFKEDSQQK